MPQYWFLLWTSSLCADQFIPAWLRDSNIDLKTIGLFAILIASLHLEIPLRPFLTSPLPPFPSWEEERAGESFPKSSSGLLLSSLAFFSPTENLDIIAIIAILIAFFSASQDIVIDAFRREILPDEELGLGNSLFVNAYRLSSIIPGSLGLFLADHYPWSVSHLMIASAMSVGILTSILAKNQRS